MAGPLRNAPPSPDEGVASPERHVAVDALTRRVANPLLSAAIRLGWGVRGARILSVVGRRSGFERRAIVIPVEIDGDLHLVAPRGGTDWVRNLRAAGTCGLRLGRHHEEFDAVEVDGLGRLPVLRHYLARNRALVAGILDDLDEDSADADLVAAATGIPVFRLTRRASRHATGFGATGDRR